MSKLKAISKETEVKILKYASAILTAHGSIAGDRCCQDWSIDEEEIEPPEEGFTKEEKQAISFNFEEWNSNGADYDDNHLFFHDEMSVSFMLSRAIEIMIKDLQPASNPHIKT